MAHLKLRKILSNLDQTLIAVIMSYFPLNHLYKTILVVTEKSVCVLRQLFLKFHSIEYLP